MVDGRAGYSRDCAWWAFRKVSQMATLYWQPMSQSIARVWSPIEEKAFADQAKVEEEALGLYKQNPAKARELLTPIASRWPRMPSSPTGSWKRISGELHSDF